MQALSITSPDDWHVHFRDGLILKNTVSATAKNFLRALIMPNLKPALTSIDSLLEYRERILAVLGKDEQFTPYMTFYLNDHLSIEDLVRAKNFPFILGAKLYPAGATTNSEEGVHSLKALYPSIDIMEQQDLVLQIHGEVTTGDVFDREAKFIELYLQPLVKNFPKLRIVMEHISTKAAVDFVSEQSMHISATITPHHLLYNRNQLFVGGIRPHFYCLPILKSETNQRALQQAAVSGKPKFFAGTDSAPHARSNKESTCGCAGIYSAPYAVAIYAQIFDSLGHLSKLNHFLGHFGAEFYKLPPNSKELILRKVSQIVPLTLPLGQEEVVPMAAGETLEWSVDEIR
ncbi:MAG: dihydroorotase [Tatlockia sp.]|nr:dihydroorotase [Tatlockia sp.]